MVGQQDEGGPGVPDVPPPLQRVAAPADALVLLEQRDLTRSVGLGAVMVDMPERV